VWYRKGGAQELEHYPISNEKFLKVLEQEHMDKMQNGMQ
jgi:hypothetical protein